MPDPLERAVEAILFASAVPVTAADLRARIGADPLPALRALSSRHEGRGVELREVAGAWAFRTAPDLAPFLVPHRVETRRLSRAGLETLAVIAYHAPVTRAEIEEIRGVALSRGTLDQLVAMGWVRLGPRRVAPGRPVTFVTTPAFLDHFGLSSAADLPGLSDLRALGMPG